LSIPIVYHANPFRTRSRLEPQAAVTNDGSYNIVVTANYNGGLWRYVEPAN
jgi:hypothetical protein